MKRCFCTHSSQYLRSLVTYTKQVSYMLFQCNVFSSSEFKIHNNLMSHLPRILWYPNIESKINVGLSLFRKMWPNYLNILFCVVLFSISALLFVSCYLIHVCWCPVCSPNLQFSICHPCKNLWNIQQIKIHITVIATPHVLWIRGPKN